MKEIKHRLRHWQRTKRLLGVVLVVLLVPMGAATFLTPRLNAFSLFGFPFGFYLVAQAGFIAMIGLVFWYRKRQEDIDREYGVSEEL